MPCLLPYIFCVCVFKTFTALSAQNFTDYFLSSQHGSGSYTLTAAQLQLQRAASRKNNSRASTAVHKKRCCQQKITV